MADLRHSDLASGRPWPILVPQAEAAAPANREAGAGSRVTPWHSRRPQQAFRFHCLAHQHALAERGEIGPAFKIDAEHGRPAPHKEQVGVRHREVLAGQIGPAIGEGSDRRCRACGRNCSKNYGGMYNLLKAWLITLRSFRTTSKFRECQTPCKPSPRYHPVQAERCRRSPPASSDQWQARRLRAHCQPRAVRFCS